MKYFFLLFLSILLPSLHFSQSIKEFQIPDSLKNRNFSQLQNDYDRVFRIDNNKGELYANTILKKAKQEKNKEFLYDGYYKIAHIKGLKSENGHPYADTLTTLTKNIDTNLYPAKAYIIKGILFNYSFKYNEALDQYIEAQKLSRNKNTDQFYYIKKLIGILKIETGENKEALSLFAEYYNYEKRKINSKEKDIKSYIGSIFSLSNAYNKNKDYKSSKLYANLGISECKKYKDCTHYPYLIMSVGIADYYLKNYPASSYNFLKIEKQLLKNEDYSNLSILYYYLGKINNEIGKEEQAVSYFTKSDSLSFTSNDFEPVARNGYEMLIDYYKKKGDKENQLKYINKLFHADSIINNSKQYLSKEIYKKYDTPILLEQKEDLITDLNNKNKLLYGVLAFGFVIIFILVYIYRENKKKIKEYQRQAVLLLEKSQETSSLSIQENKITKGDIPKEEKVKNIISGEKREDIKSKLTAFEISKNFLQKNITVESLAKTLGTNRDYLSKSVNEIKGKNFSQYLNELRINYIVEELNNNEKIRKYTISAIADDIGFNNSESFSNAFKKMTGTLPSYYIKLLQEKSK